MKVAKFGGSSIANPERLACIVEIVHGDPSIQYVVVSAPGREKKTDTKVTDLLILAHSEATGGVSFDNTLAIISEKFQRLADSVRLNIQTELAQIKHGIAVGNSVDWVASRGEWLTAKIAAAALGFEFIDSTELIRFTYKNELEEIETRKRIRSRLKHPAVISGFYGSLPEGEIKTFKRGGSDITGAIIAAHTEASLYLNYTDVPGFLTADPTIVASARQIPRLTYGEVRELSWAGASVLHAETIFPVQNYGIPIKVLSTFEPEKGGTYIYSNETLQENASGITGIAGRTDFTRVTLGKAAPCRE